jgi:pilus assembly protein CpaE
MSVPVRRLIVILSSADHEPWAQEVVAALDAEEPAIIVGSPADVAEYLSENTLEPTELIIDIGSRGSDILPEIDALAQHCMEQTRVVAVGETNDVQLYRALLGRGILDYIPMPATATDIMRALQTAPSKPAATPTDLPAKRNSQLVAFMSAGSGDGASTLALNSAYALSTLQPEKKLVLIDMDYQYGMVAKHLDLKAQYGIKELFDHPDRGVDATLIQRMVAKYGNMHVITAPSELRFVPHLQAGAMESLIHTLSQSYDYIILDLPHFWQPWVAAACKQADRLMLVAQLWLKSTTHAARIMKVWRDDDISPSDVSLVINRAGAKFKEAISPEDFERVCGAPIAHYVVNDIATVGAAEAQAKAILQLDDANNVGSDIMAIAQDIAGIKADPLPTDMHKGRGFLRGLLNLKS